MDIGEYLRGMLEKYAETVADLSRATGISRSTLDSIMKRGSEQLSAVNLVKIAEHFGTTAENICIVCGLVKSTVRSEQIAELMDKLSALDSFGILGVLKTVNEEYERARAARTDYDMRDGGEMLGSTRDISSAEADRMGLGSFRQKVTDPALVPEFLLGELITVAPGQQPAIGQACLYEWRDYGWLFRESARGPVPCNPKYPADTILEEGEFLGTVVGTANPGSPIVRH